MSMTEDRPITEHLVPPLVMVVDDDPAVRNSLSFLLESVGLTVRTFALPHDLLADWRPDRPGCIILDVRMPEMTGLELQAELRRRGCQTPIIVTSGFADVPTAVQAMEAGAVTFLEKSSSRQRLVERVQQAVQQDVERLRVSADASHDLLLFRKLTKRELEVLRLVTEGLSSKEIGVRLNVSYKTVEAHRAKMMRRLQLTSTMHLVRLYLRYAGTV